MKVDAAHFSTPTLNWLPTPVVSLTGSLTGVIAMAADLRCGTGVCVHLMCVCVCVCVGRQTSRQGVRGLIKALKMDWQMLRGKKTKEATHLMSAAMEQQMPAKITVVGGFSQSSFRVEVMKWTCHRLTGPWRPRGRPCFCLLVTALKPPRTTATFHGPPAMASVTADERPLLGTHVSRPQTKRCSRLMRRPVLHNVC